MPGTVTCERCGKEFQRKSDRGVAPRYCYDGPCRGEIKAESGHQIKGLSGQPAAVPRLSAMEQEAEAKRAEARDYVPPPSWLDEPEIQEQLAQRNEEAVTVWQPDADAPVMDSGLVEVTDASYPTCRAPDCGAQPLHPDRAHLFCLNHWLRLPLDTRGTLLNSEPGSSPFNANVIRAIRSLR